MSPISLRSDSLQYIDSMNMNKIKALLFLLMVCSLASAQVTTPYSMYGYGVIGDRATSMQRQMGGVGYAMNSGRQINSMNPASYASADSLTFLFDMGADLSLLWTEDNGVRERSTGGGLDYITMQFPLSKYMGGSIGLIPYSSVGYAFGNDIKHGTMENQGEGGINEAYLGVAGRYAGVALGVNVAYSFGTIANDVFSQPQNAGQSKFEHVMQVRDWNLNIGLQYTFKINKFNRMTIGLTYTPKKSLHGNTWATVQELSKETVPDTVGYMKMKGNYYTPNSFGGGLSYIHERNSKFMVEVDATYQQWSKAKFSPLYATDEPGKLVFQGMNFINRYKAAAGVEYVPKLRGNYLQRIAYRMGGYYTRDYLNINGNHVKEYGITAGFGLPTPEGKTLINLGFEWKARHASPQKLVSENYFNINLGVNFNEVWFWKRKIK